MNEIEQITWNAKKVNPYDISGCIRNAGTECSECGLTHKPIRLTVMEAMGPERRTEKTVDLRFDTFAEACKYARKHLGLP